MIARTNAIRRRLLRRFRPPRTAGTVILLYHRVAELAADPQLLSVTPQHFAEQMECIAQRCVPLSLSELMQRLKSGSAPERGVVVTFDDGYFDNFIEAKPILERRGIPATVFVVAGNIGSREEFFWDDLERVLLTPGSLPENIDLEVAGRRHTFRLDGAHEYDESTCRQHRLWNVTQSTDPTERHRIYRRLCQLLQPLPHGARRHAINQLSEQAGRGTIGRDTHRCLTPAELRHLTAGGLVEVGAHTITHPTLRALEPRAQRDETIGSKLQLEEILGTAVTSFSYPFGRRCDYSRGTPRMVRQAGFQVACSNFPGAIRRHAKRFELPRFLVRNWDRETFTRQLEEWFVE